jgi:hypothetical protein
MTEEQNVKEWFPGEIYEKGDKVLNPLSGQSAILNNIELSLYDYIMGCNICVSLGIINENINTNLLNKCHDYILKSNPEAYMKLID